MMTSESESDRGRAQDNNANHPRITVVTPSLNQAEFVEQTLRSVLDQGYENLEYIVLDGGSTDGSPDIIARYENQLAFWRSRPDDGQSAALREGFEMATGDILTWLNSDDMLAPGALRGVADAWQRHGPGVIVAGGCQLLDNDQPGATHYPWFQQRNNSPEMMPLDQVFDMARHWFPGEFFYQPEVFFPAKEYRTVGGVNPSFHLTMDYDLWARFAIAQIPVVVLETPLALYREHDAQKTASKQPLYEEMIETANAYLASPEVELPVAIKARLTRLNTAAGRRPVRGAWKLIRRLQRTLPW